MMNDMPNYEQCLLDKDIWDSFIIDYYQVVSRFGNVRY